MTTELTADDLTTGTELVYQTKSVDYTNDRDYSKPVRGTVVDVVEETKHLPSKTIEQTLVVIETDDGDEKRININHFGADSDTRFGIVDEPDKDSEDDQEDDEQEIVCDGGEDATAHVDDETIEDAIDRHDDSDHPEAWTVAEIRDLLAWVQQCATEGWDVYMDRVEDGQSEVVAEDRETVVLSTGEHNSVGEELDHYDGDLEVDSIAKSIVTHIHHELASERCDRNWGVDYPFVMVKPDSFDGGQRFAEAVVNGLQRRGLSPGQAWAYYGVEIRGESRNSWGLRKGDHDHRNVSDALEKAKQKLP